MLTIYNNSLLFEAEEEPTTAPEDNTEPTPSDATTTTDNNNPYDSGAIKIIKNTYIIDKLYILQQQLQRSGIDSPFLRLLLQYGYAIPYDQLINLVNDYLHHQALELQQKKQELEQ